LGLIDVRRDYVGERAKAIGEMAGNFDVGTRSWVEKWVVWFKNAGSQYNLSGSHISFHRSIAAEAVTFFVGCFVF